MIVGEVVLLIGTGMSNITVGEVTLFVWEEYLFVGEVTNNDHVLVSLAHMQNKSVLRRAPRIYIVVCVYDYST